MTLHISESSSSFIRLLREIAILIIGTLVLSALVTPSLYVGLEKLLGEVGWPYSRVFDRVAMLAAALIIYIRFQHYDVSQYREEFLGYLRGPKLWPLILGFALSLLLSLSALPFLVSDGTLQWSNHSSGEVLWRLTKSIPAAGVISLIEEAFFRFFLFLSLRRYLSFITSASITSLLYAVVHFIQPVKTWSFGQLDISTGFSYLALLMERYTQPGFLEAGFGLFLVGLVLCTTVERTGSIIPAIGLHAGWVATTKVVGRLVEASAGFEYPTGSGRRYYLLTDEVTWLTILIVGCVAFFAFRKRTFEKEVQAEGALQKETERKDG